MYLPRPPVHIGPMVLQFDKRPQPTYGSTLAWIGRGALRHYRYQLTALAAVAAVAWPGVLVALLFQEWLDYGWLAVLAWGLLTSVQAANFLRQYDVSVAVENLSASSARRPGLSPPKHSLRWLYVVAVFGVAGFLAGILIAGEILGQLFGPAGVLVGVIAMQVIEGLLNNRNRSLAVFGVALAERLLVAVQQLSAHERQLLGSISDDLSGLFADGVLGFWRVS